MRSLVCFNPPIRRCTPCSKLFFLVHVLSNVIAPASLPLSALRTSHSLPRKVRRQDRWQSDETWRVGRGQVVAFLSYLEEQGYDLERIDVGHVDVYFQHITHRLSRMTLRNVATGLRAWFRFCEAQGWTQPGLADAILLPRIYQHERLPLGPT